jgi:hypothetical protein
MTMSPDPERDDALLQAMLQDETWQTANAAFKAEALSTFRVRQRVRRLTKWAGAVAALAAVLLSLVHWSTRSAAPSRHAAVAPAPAPQADRLPRQLTDEQLVASFPKGSCFIAEVDGKKELVFLDPKLERTYVARSSTAGNQ